MVVVHELIVVMVDALLFLHHVVAILFLGLHFLFLLHLLPQVLHQLVNAHEYPIVRNHIQHDRHHHR